MADKNLLCGSLLSNSIVKEELGPQHPSIGYNDTLLKWQMTRLKKRKCNKDGVCSFANNGSLLVVKSLYLKKMCTYSGNSVGLCI